MKHPLLLGERWLINLFAAHRFRGLAKYPRVGDRPAADHHSVNSAFIETLERLFRRGYIAAADHRNRNRALHGGDHIPVGPSAVALREARGFDSGEARFTAAITFQSALPL